MAEKVISMKIWSAVIAKAEGLEVNVAAECARAGVSRALFYKLLDRYNELPPVGRSRWLRGRDGLGLTVVLLPGDGGDVAEAGVPAA